MKKYLLCLYLLLILVSCSQHNAKEVKTEVINWQEELLGFGEMWSDKDTAHQDFYYFGNLREDSTKLTNFRFGLPHIRVDTLFVPNKFMYYSFRFFDSLKYKWEKGCFDKDTSAYLISRDSTGIIHLKKVYGIKWTPRRLYVSMSARTFDSGVKYFKNSSRSPYRSISMLVDSVRGIHYFTTLRSKNQTYQREDLSFTHADSIIYSSFVNDLVKNRLKIQQIGGILCGAGRSTYLLYSDSIYEFDNYSFVINLGVLEKYFMFKLNRFKDTMEIEFNNLNYVPHKLFRGKPIAREIEAEIPPPSPEFE